MFYTTHHTLNLEVTSKSTMTRRWVRDKVERDLIFRTTKEELLPRAFPLTSDPLTTATGLRAYHFKDARATLLVLVASLKRDSRCDSDCVGKSTRLCRVHQVVVCGPSGERAAVLKQVSRILAIIP